MAVATTRKSGSRGKRDLLDVGKSLYKDDQLPKEFAWIEHLTEAHRRQFFYEFKRALGEAMVEENRSIVVELLEDWQATAEIDSNPEFAAEIQRRLKARDEYEDW